MIKSIRRMCLNRRLQTCFVSAIVILGTMLSLTAPRAAADTEPNDSFGTAEAITPGIHVGDLGVNPPADSDDYYSLVLTAAGQTVYANVTILPGGLTGDLTFYNALQTAVGGVSFGPGTYGADYTFATAQTIYIRLALTGGSGAYSLQVAITSQNDANSGGDAGNDITGPTPVTPGTYPGCVLKGEDGNDYYSLVLTAAGQTVYANVTILPGGLTGDLTLYNELQTAVGGVSFGPGTYGADYTFATAQTIYIRLALTGGSGAYDMEIFVTGIPIDQTPPTISHIPVTTGLVGSPIAITATVTDNVLVDKVYLNFTNVAGANSNVSMSKSGDTYSYDIAAQTTAGTVIYFIWANDTRDNEKRTPAYTITVSADTTPPTIVHAAVTSAFAGDAITITATITDNIGVQGATLYYRKKGDATYTNLALSASGNTYSAVIPASAVTTAGVQYYISATDGTNTATAPTNPSTAPYEVSVSEKTTAEGFPWIWVIIIVIILVVVILLVMLLMRRKKPKPEIPPPGQTGQ